MKRRLILLGLTLISVLALILVVMRRPAASSVLYTAMVGQRPSAVVVDGRTGRVFVANINTGVPVPAQDSWAWLPRWLRSWLPFLPRPHHHMQTPRGSVTVIDPARL